MKSRIMIGLWVFVGVLELLSGLRDIFAPGFFTISGQVRGTGDIVLEFVAAACFFGIAALTRMSRQAKSLNPE